LLNAIAGGWNLNAQYTAHSGYPFAFPNAANLVAQTANLRDSQRDANAQKAGRKQFDPSYDVWFNTSIFPTQAHQGESAFAVAHRFPQRFQPSLVRKPGLEQRD